MRSNLHGLLLIRKPTGVTSHDVIQQARRQLGTKEVGHAGTLDPLAEGLMVLLLGEATKMSSFVLEKNKQYELSLKLGIETDTLDITGKIVRESSAFSWSKTQVLEHAIKLQGDFTWEVPLYSATKVGGRKLYELAREGGGSEVDIPRKPMSFWGLELLEGDDSKNNIYRFRLNCSKGSFIRTWIHQLGQQLGCGAVMTELTRTYSAPYLLGHAISLEGLSERATLRETKAFIPMLSALPEFKSVRVSGASEALIRNGQISHELRRRLIVSYNPESDLGVKILSQHPEELLALVGLEKDKGFVVKRVFRY